MNNDPRIRSRRRFLGQAACSAVTATPILSSILNLKMVGNAVAAEGGSDDYKALVCLFQGGGNDSFNMLVPRGASEYSEYQAARTSLALPLGSLHALNGMHGGKSFGTHPGMPEVASLYNANKLAFISNVGTLVEPVNLVGFNNGTAKLPLGMFSHSDQIMHWQTSVPNERSPFGWGGRAADILNACNSNQRISMNISLTGSNVFQSGREAVSYEIESSRN